MSDDDFLKPKNQTLEKRKKQEQVYYPELHSNPELMSYSEKLELAEEILCEVLRPVLEREGLKAEVLDVVGSVISMRAGSVPETVRMELGFMVSEATEGVFSLKVE